MDELCAILHDHPAKSYDVVSPNRFRMWGDGSEDSWRQEMLYQIRYGKNLS